LCAGRAVAAADARSVRRLIQEAAISRDGAPLTHLSLFCGACALFAMLYGALEVEAGSGMALVLVWGPAVAVAWWLAVDSKRTGVIGAYDAGLLFYLTWPVTLPWYAWRSRGRDGWGLAAKLYGLAVAGQLGYVLGATLRFVLVSRAGSAA
jgi:hypothetical protein